MINILTRRFIEIAYFKSMRAKRLLIVSDTRMQFRGGEYYAFNSVVKELDVFVELFDEITWIGYDNSDLVLDATYLKVSHPQVKLIMLPRSGGKYRGAKLKILYLLPLYYLRILKESNKADIVHSRGPSVPMLLALILSFFKKKQKWWFKYANDWSKASISPFWAFQKKLLLKNSRVKATVNGDWPDLKPHIIPFENPCLDSANPSLDYTKAEQFNEGWNLLYVGRLVEEKGIKRILESIAVEGKEKINKVIFIGGGSMQTELENLSKNAENISIQVLGPKSKEEVFQAMRESHFLLLPSTSPEGFPKVIAEAWHNGCIPITSNVSSIGQYVVDGGNGFLWDVEQKAPYSLALKRALNVSVDEYRSLMYNAHKMSGLFTYQRYKERIESLILAK